MNSVEAKDFEAVYERHRRVLERFVYCRVANPSDAQEISQEVWLAAHQGLAGLRDPERAKSWLLGIARHKCTDYSIRQAERLELADISPEREPVDSHGRRTAAMVWDTLERLPDRERQILYLYGIRGMAQADIAVLLQIPLGTVKSRVFAAKRRFRALYPCPPRAQMRGEPPMDAMKHEFFPPRCPAYTVTPSAQPVIPIRWEQNSGCLHTPRLDEHSRFAFYDDPDRRLTGVCEQETVRPAEIHGVSCVEIHVRDTEPSGESEKTLFMQETDTHIRYIAEITERGGVFHLATFLDDDWRERYEIGENNIGYEIEQSAKGIVRMEGRNLIITQDECPDILGRYELAFGDRRFDTEAIAVKDGELLTVNYVLPDGRTALCRRFNGDSWELARYDGTRWSERFPDSERLTVNGSVFVHWYDCVPAFIL